MGYLFPYMPYSHVNFTNSPNIPTLRMETRFIDGDVIPSEKAMLLDPSKGHSISCALKVSDESRTFFTQAVHKEKYNFMYLKLHFHNGTEVNETKKVINRFDWIWTYKGEGGAHQYLYLPGDFGYLSFGLLWLHTRTYPTDIDIDATGDCRKLQIGTNETDELIGRALGSMTAPIAFQDMKYNYSYWCYNYRMWIESNFLYYLCKKSICTLQTVEYRCCKYVLHMNMTRTIECNKDHYHYGALWWVLPIVVGHILFAFYPIVLMKIGMFVNLPSDISNANQDNTNENSNRRCKFVSLKDHFPITFLGTILSPLLERDCSGPIISRVLRLWLIIFPITICVIRVCLDYMYNYHLIIEAVRKGALFGVSTLIAGPMEAKYVILQWFTGPITRVVIFIVFSGAIIVFPKHLDECLAKGHIESNKRYNLLVKMPLKLTERFSGISIRKHVGYMRLHQLLTAQTFMLLHWKFWRHALKLFHFRWSNLIHQLIYQNVRNRFLALIVLVIIFPFYVIISFFELFVTAIYFMFPVVNSLLIVLKAFMIEYFALFQNRGICLKLLRNIFTLPLIGLFLFSWYMYCITFFDAFWFLSKIVMFTYSGIIAYPKISYGYVILCLMSVYYLTESVNAFGESYRDLLKVSIDVIAKIHATYDDDQAMFEMTEFKDLIDKHSMNKDLFFYIVKKHRPRRNQVMITLLKCFSMITILTISVKLLNTFDKLQDLSLVSHVFTVIFVCSLPKIIRMICFRRYQVKMKKLRANIKKTFFLFARQRINTDSDGDVEVMHIDYESISVNDVCSDNECVHIA